MKHLRLSFLTAIAATMVATLSTPAQAQMIKENRTTATYLLGFPLGETAEFTRPPSFLGGELDFATVLSRNTEASFLMGWQRFQENETASQYTDPTTGAVITSDQEKSLTTIPFLFKYRYYVESDKGFKIFGGIAGGATYVQRKFYAGSFDLSAYGWQFAVRPEAGITYELRERGALVTSLRWDYGFKSGSLPALSTLSLGFGYQATF